MKKHHIITLASFIIIFKILVVIGFIYVAFTFTYIKADLYQIKKDQANLKLLLDENQQKNQEQILQLTNSILSTQSNLENQIIELKSETSPDFSDIIPDTIKGVISVATDQSQGSGFIFTPEGYALTNAHVLSGGKYVKVLTYDSDKWVNAQLIGYDSDMDIAILKIEGKFENLKFGDSDQVQAGEKTIAMGNPLGLSFSVSEGIISAVHRSGPNNIAAYFQTDVPLNRGNSGGPLINKKGEVIGVNNFKLQNSENLGFALESNYAKETINNILRAQNLSIVI